jgi:hypothetical protein
LPALGEPAPEIIDLHLVLAIDLEGDGFVECELRAAIERDEFLARQLEVHGHDRSGLLAVDVLAFVGIARDREDLRVLNTET